MITLTCNIAAAILYMLASIYQITQLSQQHAASKSWQMSFSLSALVLHGIGIAGLIFVSEGFHLGFFLAFSLICWAINLLVFLSSLRKPLHNIFILLFPVAAIAVIFATFTDSPVIPSEELSGGVVSHILLSIVAYSLLSIATFQALLLAYQIYQLKHKHPNGLARLLPPLLTMEKLLFELLWAGEILLTLSIISGLIFLENMFTQHLTHKTIFSIAAWLIYATLLAGHYFKGWRGPSAVRWTLGGFAALLLAYFGTKLVLEIILH